MSGMGCSCSRFAKFVREYVFNQPRYEEVVDRVTVVPRPSSALQLAPYQAQQLQGQTVQLPPLRKTLSKEILTSKVGFFSAYALAEEIGNGSTSRVFRCVRKSDGTSFACKVIDKSSCRGEAYQHLLDQFAEEVRVLNLVKQHPNVINLVDSFETPDRIYVVTELMSGGELFDYIIDRGALSEDEASAIARSICSAVAYMHSLHIIHRDIKPENLLLSSKSADSMQVKLIDFGLAKILPDAGAASAVSFLGTKGYLAPEMLKRNKYGKSIDVWAVGVIVFVLLCGCLPFDNDSAEIRDEEAARQKFSLRFPSWASDLSDSAKDLLRRLLDVHPGKRLTAEQACKHPWIVGSSVKPQNILSSAHDAMGSQRDLLRLNPQSLLYELKKDHSRIK